MTNLLKFYYPKLPYIKFIKYLINFPDDEKLTVMTYFGVS